jgi:hypothetical protein
MFLYQFRRVFDTSKHRVTMSWSFPVLSVERSWSMQNHQELPKMKIQMSPRLQGSSLGPLGQVVKSI